MARQEWLCLNGTWEFEVDAAGTGEERGLLDRRLQTTIRVPFAPEAPLSGLGLDDFLPAVWYRRELEVPSEWTGRKVLLHFQAVDYDATVWVNGQEVGRHLGGFTPLSCELSAMAPGRTATIVVRARDDPDRPQPRGKQSDRLRPYGSRCARTTGIWQTVWAEPVPLTRLCRPRLTPDLTNGCFVLHQKMRGERRGLFLEVCLSDGEGPITRAVVPADRELTPQVRLAVPPSRRRLWAPEDPHLYGVAITLRDASGAETDRVETYGGLRSLALADGAVLLNGRPRFQRLVLDQGYWPDGGLTAPDDDALARDIQLAQAAGFDGARAHQRVAEERWLYHADRLGFLVWGEFPDWGNRRNGPPVHHVGFPIEYAGEWLEVLERDYSHPCVVGWCALNETEVPVGGQPSDLDGPTTALYRAARAADATRPVIDVSGYHHRVSGADIWDCHDYEQDPAAFAAHYEMLPGLVPEVAQPAAAAPWPPPQPGQAIFVSEFGGAVLSLSGPSDGAYGEPLASSAQLLDRFQALCGALLGNDRVAGYSYTQLVDTYSERNGLLDAHRRPKVPLEILARAQRRPAAIEKRVTAVDFEPPPVPPA
jgi:beta-galactosidase/beta-glucuronidase